jgi:hypothetical protein
MVLPSAWQCQFCPATWQNGRVLPCHMAEWQSSAHNTRITWLMKILMMKMMVLMLRTMFSCSDLRPSITLCIITITLPLQMIPKSKFVSQIPLMDPSLGSCTHSLFNVSLISKANPRPSVQIRPKLTSPSPILRAWPSNSLNLISFQTS